jgi:hypothetical protein
VDRIVPVGLWEPPVSRLPRFFFLLFLHVVPHSPIIAVTALTGTRVMNRMSVEGGGAGPVALR